MIFKLTLSILGWILDKIFFIGVGIGLTIYYFMNHGGLCI